MNKEKLIVLFFILYGFLAGAEEIGKRKHIGMVHNSLQEQETRSRVRRAYSQRPIEKRDYKKDRLKRLSSGLVEGLTHLDQASSQNILLGDQLLRGLFFCKGVSYWGGLCKVKPG